MMKSVHEITGMGSTTQAIQPTGPVISECMEQNKALNALEDAISELAQAISPILSEPSTGNGQSEPSSLTTCELHTRLRSSTEQIAGLRSAVKSLIGRVQL